MVYAARGKLAEALEVIKELEEISGASLSQAHWVAKIYATLIEEGGRFNATKARRAPSLDTTNPTRPFLHAICQFDAMIRRPRATISPR
jgi:hypothetical protein